MTIAVGDAPRLHVGEHACAWAFNSGLTSATYLSATAVVLVPQLHVSITAAVAVVAFYWMMYLVDRTKPAPEDMGTGGAADFMREHLGAFRVLLGITIAAQLVCYLLQPRLALAALASIAISLAYLVPIPLLGKRIKELPGCKPPYLGVTVAVITGSFMWADGSPPSLVGVVLVALNVAVNTAAYDLKDVEGDRRAGLPTLASILGPRLLPTLHVVNLATIAIAWIFAPTPTALVATLVALFYVAALAVVRRRAFDVAQSALIDSGTTVILVLGWLLTA